MKVTSTKVTVVVPLHHTVNAHEPSQNFSWLRQELFDDPHLVCLNVRQCSSTRVFWNEVVPCLLQSDENVAACFLSLVLNELVREEMSHTITTRHIESNESSKEEAVNPPCCLQKRSLAVHTTTFNPQHLVLWIQPPPTRDTIDDSFMGRLLKWEHSMLQTQSLAGYYSTLGGGFFMCRHFQTAVVLAQEQERMALRLNDPTMYYKCRLNAAYNFIYAGKFGVAKRRIREVLVAVSSERMELSESRRVLVNMCHSALWFCQKVREAKVKRVDESNVDDLARIRVSHDRSRHDDLLKPFGRE